MKIGVLEVLLVKASGLKHCGFIGSSGLYAIVQCGALTFKGKITAARKRRVWWNEKFVFRYASMEWRRSTHLSVRIMKKRDKFRDDIFVGETIVHLGGVLEEGNQSGCMHVEPTPYNVVLSDGTYQGQLQLGLNFTLTNDIMEAPAPEMEEEDAAGDGGGVIVTEVARRPALYGTLLRLTLWRIPWGKLFSFRRCSGSPAAQLKKNSQ